MSEQPIPTEQPKIADKRLKNLRPWKKGEAPRPKHSGRPKKLAWLEDFKEHMSDPKRAKALFDSLRKKKPDIAMAYLAGKPVDTVLIGGASDAPPVQIEEITAAAAIARKNRGLE